jgi:rod shape-determining protein MreD
VSSGGARTLEPWRWLGLPMLQAMAASLLLAIPIRLWGFALPEPVFAMPVAFAWAVIRPSMLAPLGVMIMGVFLDLLWGGPTGFWAVCLLIAYGAALGGRSMLAGQGKAMMWVWYGTLTAVVFAAGYLITMLDAKAMPSPLSVFWQFLATLVLYPFSDRLIERFEDADVRFR